MNGFTWLDHGDIEQKRAVVPFSRLPEAFFARFGDTGFYRPIVTVIHSIDATIYGNFSPGYHLTNVLLHGIASITIPLLLSAFFVLTAYEMLFICFLFSIHPVTILPTGAISYRPELFLIIFIGISIFFYAAARRSGSRKKALVSGISAFFAYSSKETAVILIPALLLLWEMTKPHSTSSHDAQKLIRPKAKTWNKQLSFLFFLHMFFISIYMILRAQAVPELWKASGMQTSSLTEAIGTRLFVIGKLILTLINPIPPSLSDAISIVTVTHPFSLFTILFLLFACYILWHDGMQSNTSKIVWLLLFFLAPAANLIAVPRVGSPHYGYIAASIFCLLCVLSLRKIQTAHLVRKLFLLCILGVWISIAAFSTFTNGSRFKNDFTLFHREVADDPHFLEGHFYLGNYYFQKRLYKEAKNAYFQSLQKHKNIHAYSERYSALTNLAGVYYAEKNLSKADAYLAEAQQIAPPSQEVNLFYNRAIIATEQKQYEKVIQLLERRNLTNSPHAMLVLANALHYTNQTDKAIQTLKASRPYWHDEQKRKIDTLIQSYTTEIPVKN